MYNGSDNPCTELKFKCGSKANKLAATIEYFSEKNFLARRYIGKIVTSDIEMLKIRATLMYSIKLSESIKGKNIEMIKNGILSAIALLVSCLLSNMSSNIIVTVSVTAIPFDMQEKMKSIIANT